MKKKETNLLADFLKQKRTAAGLSQRDVADELGYETPQFISNWERGVSFPPISALKDLGELYKISADDLFEVTLQATVKRVTNEMKRKFFSSRSK